MLNDLVANMEPIDRFLYWVKERHEIYKRRKKGQPKPWTDDEVLQSYFFTNPYRENDKTTVWFREYIREPLREKNIVLFATVAFRWFNLPRTGIALIEADPRFRFGLLEHWNENLAVKTLQKLWGNGANPVFTGAFMIKSPRGSKIPNICSTITDVWNSRHDLYELCYEDRRLQALWKALKQFRFLGGFMAYEIVCDLRYTSLLETARDVDTWCNIGPGAKRGLNRLMGKPLESPITQNFWDTETAKLLKLMRSNLKGMPRFEMREVEHSLCEFDKYERALSGVGRMKRKYHGLS